MTSSGRRPFVSKGGDEPSTSAARVSRVPFRSVTSVLEVAREVVGDPLRLESCRGKFLRLSCPLTRGDASSSSSRNHPRASASSRMASTVARSCRDPIQSGPEAASRALRSPLSPRARRTHQTRTLPVRVLDRFVMPEQVDERSFDDFRVPARVAVPALIPRAVSTRRRKIASCASYRDRAPPRPCPRET